jgi:hypothetical protein
MKLLVLIGGIAGFAIGLISGVAGQGSWPMSIWRACLATYVAALLARWWGRIWMQSLKQSYGEHIAAVAKPPRQLALTHSKP